ncbi:MAG: TolC family protein [Bacteroidetes bacterium]|nr:TolC family protein [Bacteroidota bacterium]
MRSLTSQAVALLTLIFFSFTGMIAVAQPISSNAADTTEKFSLDEFYRVVLEYHPMVRQARLLNESARQELRLARGSFDPKAEVQLDKKEFQNKSYYNKLDAYLSFPTWFPVNPKLGMENNTGQLLNSAETIPGGRQYFAGVNLPIGKGLFTDERRAMVKQASLLTTLSEAEQVKQINKVLLQAAKDYWQWYNSYHNLLLTEKGVTIAQEIYRRVKLNHQHGEASRIDTMQAKIIWQSRKVERMEAQLAFRNTSLALSNYLWDAASQPLQLSTKVSPVIRESDQLKIDDSMLQSLIERARQNHPELIKYKTKLNQLGVERSLAKEFLKPKLDLSYYVLTQPGAPQAIDFSRDYKLGVDFSMPIFLRKERSKLALTDLKISSTEFEQRLAEREIINEITATYNQITNTGQMIEQLAEMVTLYDQLLNAEMMNLEHGESDLFKISLQQEKLIQAQIKLLKLQVEQQKAKASLYWAAGVRNLNFE